MKKEAVLFYPHQIFDESSLLKKDRQIFIIEDPLFFTQYKFHKKKLILHRASMKAFEERLEKSGFNCTYIEVSNLSSSSDITNILKENQISKIYMHDPVDDWLKRVIVALEDNNISVHFEPSLNFINHEDECNEFFDKQDSYFFTSFYVWLRKKENILLDNNKKPIGGKWTFDGENRKKLPKGHVPPALPSIKKTKYLDEAIKYVENKFPNNPGISENFSYPLTPTEAKSAFLNFLEYRFHYFGDYEDAISNEYSIIYHSVLTPALNIGLISPRTILELAIEYGFKNNVPLNSLEGFIRQVLGWREYMRMIYIREGRKQRCSNFLSCKREIPSSFWTAETGIEPIDHVISSINNTAYCHHIERLMILGNFMLLCDFSPHEVYEWFMALFIDSYDWVMVPNVYGMSQYSDGGLITTKPYVSSSNYVLKMSNFKKDNWCDIWDGLYWRFINKHKDFMLKNPRMSLMPKQLEKMDKVRKTSLLKNAEAYLSNL